MPANLQLLATWPLGYSAFFSAVAAAAGDGGVPEDPEVLTPFVAGALELFPDCRLTWQEAWRTS